MAGKPGARSVTKAKNATAPDQTGAMALQNPVLQSVASLRRYYPNQVSQG